MSLPGRLAEHLLKKLPRHKMRAGAGREKTALPDEPHAVPVDGCIAFRGIPDIRAGLRKGRRVENHEVILLSLGAQFRQKVQHISGQETDILEAIQIRIPFRHLNRFLRGIHTCHFFCASPGGIQRTIQIWLHGQLTDATLDIDASNGTYAIRDQSGHITQSGGGVAINQDGTERPLTAKEIKEDLANTPDTETVNGRTCLLLGGQRIDITDRFDDSGFCYITVRTGSGKLYVTVRKNGGLASSPNRYVLPDEFAAG